MSFADDYVDVAERTREFFERYPEGSIQCEPPAVVRIADRDFVAVTASAYRTPDDPTPSRASAWEPFPGKTNFTRDSEAMNCETSAVGRALAFLGIAAKRIATRQDVQARQEPIPPSRKQQLLDACGGDKAKAGKLWSASAESMTDADFAEFLAGVS